ncbi:hypothetical protein KIW84_060102, partial [Lathyrus oleraceus]
SLLLSSSSLPSFADFLSTIHSLYDLTFQSSTPNSWGEVVQMELEPSNQPKQERSRTRWTASLDRIFADLVVKQIQLGNRQNDVFDKKTWNHIRDEFNKQTDLNFNNNQLRKHLDVLRTRFNNLKPTNDQNNGFVIDDPLYVGFDQWEDIGVSKVPL